MILEVSIKVWKVRCALCSNSELILDLEAIRQQKNMKQVYIEALSEDGELYKKGWRSKLSENIHYCPECMDKLYKEKTK